MLTKKATVDQLEALDSRNLDSFRTIWKDLRKLQAKTEEQDERLDRYSLRLTKIMQTQQHLERVVNHNAIEGARTNGGVSEALGGMKELKTAIDLLAAEIGTKVSILPEVPTTVTVQPGLPERLGLEKLTKSERKALTSETLPEPQTLVQGENGGLFLVRD